MKSVQRIRVALIVLLVFMLMVLGAGCVNESESGKAGGNAPGAESSEAASASAASETAASVSPEASASTSSEAEASAAPEAAASYADTLFDTTHIHTIEVTMSEEDRAEQLANPTDKTKYEADVVIDGEAVEGITFHTKGNSSLFFVAKAGRDKFSYGINFGKQEKGRSFHGLDKLNLQNFFVDATLEREYMSHWLFREMGLDAPLASYVWLTVNGEDQGLYLALEDVDDSFLNRTGRTEGTAYKPEAQGMALNDKEADRIAAGNSAAHDGSGGADLVYRGDDEQSYPDIFENAETDEDEGTRARVIESLKALSGGSDLESHLDTDEIIRYFAVHNYLVNYDSYTGLMLHNYVLYEADGKLAMLPWDYDHSFGGFPDNAVIGSDIDSNAVVNAGIDSPIGGATDEERPMWRWILSDEKYLGMYHDALDELVNIIDSGQFAQEANRIHELIRPHMESDSKSIYAPDEFEKAHETMLAVSDLRAESVRKQLAGELSTKSELQAAEDQVDASGVATADMGSSNRL